MTAPSTSNTPPPRPPAVPEIAEATVFAVFVSAELSKPDQGGCMEPASNCGQEMLGASTGAVGNDGTTGSERFTMAGLQVPSPVAGTAEVRRSDGFGAGVADGRISGTTDGAEWAATGCACRGGAEATATGR